MEEMVAPVSNMTFDIEIALHQQLGAQPLPFPGMDKSGSAICTFFMRTICSKGTACPFRHVKGDRTVVCKHWLRGLCKKGDDCEFLHEYDMSKMPECYFFSKFGQCSNKECPFLHIDPEAKIKDCPWYDRGFCRHESLPCTHIKEQSNEGLVIQQCHVVVYVPHPKYVGPNCKNRHVRRLMCINYLCGFCIEGPECKYVHPRFELPAPDPVAQARKMNITCHYCNESGHKAANCPKLPPGVKIDSQPPQIVDNSESHYMNHSMMSQERRPLGEVTCYKCGEKGHYANKCPKGHLAFLSNPNAGQQTHPMH